MKTNVRHAGATWPYIYEPVNLSHRGITQLCLDIPSAHIIFYLTYFLKVIYSANKPYRLLSASNENI
jgi:hypothetical protein